MEYMTAWTILFANFHHRFYAIINRGQFDFCSTDLEIDAKNWFNVPWKLLEIRKYENEF